MLNFIFSLKNEIINLYFRYPRKEIVCNLDRLSGLNQLKIMTAPVIFRQFSFLLSICFCSCLQKKNNAAEICLLSNIAVNIDKYVSITAFLRIFVTWYNGFTVFENTRPVYSTPEMYVLQAAYRSNNRGKNGFGKMPQFLEFST